VTTSKGSKSEKLCIKWLVIYFEDNAIAYASHSNLASSKGEIHRLIVKSKSIECTNSLVKLNSY